MWDLYLIAGLVVIIALGAVAARWMRRRPQGGWRQTAERLGLRFSPTGGDSGDWRMEGRLHEADVKIIGGGDRAPQIEARIPCGRADDALKRALGAPAAEVALEVDGGALKVRRGEDGDQSWDDPQPSPELSAALERFQKRHPSGRVRLEADLIVVGVPLDGDGPRALEQTLRDVIELVDRLPSTNMDRTSATPSVVPPAPAEEDDEARLIIKDRSS